MACYAKSVTELRGSNASGAGPADAPRVSDTLPILRLYESIITCLPNGIPVPAQLRGFKEKEHKGDDTEC